MGEEMAMRGSTNRLKYLKRGACQILMGGLLCLKEEKEGTLPDRSKGNYRSVGGTWGSNKKSQGL